MINKCCPLFYAKYIKDNEIEEKKFEEQRKEYNNHLMEELEIEVKRERGRRIKTEGLILHKFLPYNPKLKDICRCDCHHYLKTIIH